MSKPTRWTIEIVKEGIDKFFEEMGRYPTSRDFDIYPHLPSARQIQRTYGGLPALREALGFKNLDYTKGDLRREIALKGYNDGLTAEENLEIILVKHFGEPYVHTQKRYGNHLKNRYDFFVYCHGECFAVDVFTTGRAEYISTNIRHKINKYKELGPFTIYFVASGPYTATEITDAVKRLPALKSIVNIKVLSEEHFLQEVLQKKKLPLPHGYVSSITSKK